MDNNNNVQSIDFAREKAKTKERIMLQMIQEMSKGAITKTKREALLMFADAMDVTAEYLEGTHVRVTKRCSEDLPVILSLNVMSVFIREWMKQGVC